MSSELDLEVIAEMRTSTVMATQAATLLTEAADCYMAALKLIGRQSREDQESSEWMNFIVALEYESDRLRRVASTLKIERRDGPTQVIEAAKHGKPMAAFRAGSAKVTHASVLMREAANQYRQALRLWTNNPLNSNPNDHIHRLLEREANRLFEISVTMIEAHPGP